MLSSMLKKINREEENIVHGYQRPVVTARRTPLSGDPVRSDPLLDVALTDTPSLHYHSFEFSSYNRSQKGSCNKGPKTAATSYRYRSSGAHSLGTKRVAFEDSATTFPSRSNNYTPGHKVRTPAYTPKYCCTPAKSHHKVMTPAYTPCRDVSPAEAASTNPGRGSFHPKKTPMYKQQYGNNMKKTVMYTPKYDPMYFDPSNCFSEGDGSADKSGNNNFFVASPTTPKYTPTSQAFQELVSHEDEAAATRGWAFSPCYNPATNWGTVINSYSDI